MTKSVYGYGLSTLGTLPACFFFHGDWLLFCRLSLNSVDPWNSNHINPESGINTTHDANGISITSTGVHACRRPTVTVLCLVAVFMNQSIDRLTGFITGNDEK